MHGGEVDHEEPPAGGQNECGRPLLELAFAKEVSRKRQSPPIVGDFRNRVASFCGRRRWCQLPYAFPDVAADQCFAGLPSQVVYDKASR